MEMGASEFTIGRDPKEAGPGYGVIANSVVSSRHAKLKFMKGRVFIEDSGSKNGTQLNGKTLELMNFSELEFDAKISFGGVTALFIADRLGESAANTDGYQEALDKLVKSKIIDKGMRDRALAQGGHPGETLIVDGHLGIDDWRRALFGAQAERKVEDLSKKAGSKRAIILVAFVAAVAAAVAAAFSMM